MHGRQTRKCHWHQPSLRWVQSIGCHNILDVTFLITEWGISLSDRRIPHLLLGKRIWAEEKLDVILQKKKETNVKLDRNQVMKRITLSILAGVLLASTASAQHYRDSRYYNPQTGHLDYSQRGPVTEPRPEIRSTPAPQTYYAPVNTRRYSYGLPKSYVGLRVGPSFSHTTSDDAALNGGRWKTGLNVGVALGTAISCNTPLYLESGLYYTEKGGKGNGGVNNGHFTYNLNYLEVPLVFKYRATSTGDFTVEPYFGGYFAVGVGGKIKDYNNREAYSAFDSNRYDNGTFRRCDAGLKFGIGSSVRLSGDAALYMEVGYDLGLADICHDTFDKAKTGALQLNVGVNL